MHGKPPLHDGAWAMATLEVCLAILQSAREGATSPVIRSRADRAIPESREAASEPISRSHGGGSR